MLSLVFLYLAWEVDDQYAYWIAPFVILAAVIYVFSPQINWWWYKRRPPKLEDKLTAMLEHFSTFYRRLTLTNKQKFRERVALFRMATDWEPLAFDDETVPPDVQLAISAQAVTILFNRPALLFEKFEKVLVYPKPFATPEFPFDHASELYEPDGCLLFSAEQVMLAFTQPSKWYNVGLHEYAKAFVLTYPDEPWPALDSGDVWDKLQAASGMPRTHVESVVGIALEALPVAIHHFFAFPEQFRQAFPEESKGLKGIFG